MNGSFINTNFAAGMLVAKNLNRQDQVLTGLTAGQMGPSSAVGLFGLKRLVDDRAGAEERAQKAEAERDATKAKLDLAVAVIARLTNLATATVADWLADPKSAAALAQAQSGSSGASPILAGPGLAASATPPPGGQTTAGTSTATGTPAPAGGGGAPSSATSGSAAPSGGATGTTPGSPAPVAPASPAGGSPAPVATGPTQASAPSPGSAFAAVTFTPRIIPDQRKYDPKDMATFRRSRKTERRKICAVI